MPVDSENPPPQDAPRLVDQTAYRDVIGRFASGVTVITTRADDRDFGTTASAVSSLSMEPPMLLVCLNTSSETQGAIHSAMRFVVNILGEDQEEVAYRFAKKSGSKFVEGDLLRSETGLPMLAQAIAQLECRVAERVRAGTQTVFLAEVENASAIEGSPLTYFRGRFGRFEDALQEAAYRRLRAMILAATSRSERRWTSMRWPARWASRARASTTRSRS